MQQRPPSLRRLQGHLLKAWVDVLGGSSPQRPIGGPECGDFHPGQVVPPLDQLRESRLRVPHEHRPELFVGHQPAYYDFDVALCHVTPPFESPRQDECRLRLPAEPDGK